MARYTDRIVSLERVRARDLVPHEANWRQHPESQVSALRGVLSEVGWSSALLAYRSNGALRLIDGHLRAGLDPDEQVPVLILDVDDAEAEKLLLSIDPLAAMAQANGEALRGLLERVETSDAGLQAMLADLNALAAPKQGRTDPDSVPEDVETRTKPGDLWLLGEHRLLCGDALRCFDLPGAATAAVLIGDPPYGIGLDTDYSSMPKTTRGFRPIIGDSEPFDAAPVRHAACGIPEQFWFGADYYAASLGDTEHGGAWLVWDKRVEEHYDVGFGSGFELVWSANRRQRVILRHQWFQNHAADPTEAGSRQHPTQKPSGLVEHLLGLSSSRGAVLDPYCGSGSSVIAAERAGQQCYATEIDPTYCDVVVARWEAFTGQTAQLE